LQCIGTAIAGAVGTTVVAVGNIAVMDVNGIAPESVWQQKVSFCNLNQGFLNRRNPCLNAPY
jgi:hypothetical protein